MGKSYRELKKKIAEQNDLLNVRDNRIAALLVANAALKAKAEKLDKRVLKLPFMQEANHALFCAEHKEVAKESNTKFPNSVKMTAEEWMEKNVCSTFDYLFPFQKAILKSLDDAQAEVDEKSIEKKSDGFSSRFMSNVKFKAPSEFISFSNILDINEAWSYYKTSADGESLIGSNLDIHKAINLREVNYTEAIPELVPEGMVYNKESDSLVQLSDNEFPSCMTLEDIASLMYWANETVHKKSDHHSLVVAGELSRATTFSISTCLSVIQDYGEVNARAVLDLIAIDVDPSGFKLKKS